MCGNSWLHWNDFCQCGPSAKFRISMQYSEVFVVAVCSKWAGVAVSKRFERGRVLHTLKLT
jgi:hypothetical protein